MTSATTIARARPSRARRRPLRILEFCDYYGPSSMGGSERVAHEVNRRLAASGVELDVATAVRGGSFVDDDIRVMHRRAFDLSPVVGAQLAFSPGYHSAALRRARALEPDVLYAHSIHFQGSVIAARVSRRLGLPLVTAVHVGALDELPWPTRAAGVLHESTVGRYVLAASRSVIAVGEHVARHCERLGVTRDRVTIVPNGVDHRRFRPSPEPDGPITVLFVGRLIDNKGPALLLEAARLLRDRGRTIRVVMVGDGPQRTNLERRSRLIGARLSFAGQVRDPSRWFQQAHIVVRPSFTEGMPLTVLEAMASKRCVVASDIPAHRAIIEHGTTGLLHRSGDAHDLAAQLEHACADHDGRGRMARQGWVASQGYSWDATARGHLHVLRRVTRPLRTI